MSIKQGNASMRFLGEEMEQDAEEESGTRTSKESSLTSSDGISHPQQNPLNSDMDNAPLATGLSMIQSKLHEITSLRSTPAFGTPQSIFPVPIQTFPPTFLSQLVDKQNHYQQMTNNSSFNSYGPQQAEAYHNFLIPTMLNAQIQAVSEYQSSRSSTPHQPFNWFPQGLGNESQESPHTSNHAPRCTNSLYDPAFEEMGLPIDPHLRLFLSSMSQNEAAGRKTNPHN